MRIARKASWYEKVSPESRVHEMRYWPSAGSSKTATRIAVPLASLAWTMKVSPSESARSVTSVVASIRWRASSMRAERCSGSRERLDHPSRLIGCGVTADWYRDADDGAGSVNSSSAS